MGDDGDGDHGRRVLASLTDREKKVLKDRFGLDVSDNLAPEDFARTRARIREIEEKVLRKLRRKRDPDPDPDDAA